MPDEPHVTIPAPPPAPRISKPPRAKPSWQIAAEMVVDLAAIAVVGLLAYGRRVDATFAVVLVCLLAGVRLSDLAGARGNGGPPGGAGGITGAVVGILSTILHRGGA